MYPSLSHAALGIAVSLLPAIASATIANVVGPTVNEGAHQIEWRGSYSWDEDSASADQRYRQRVHYDAGITDWLALRGIVFHDKNRGEDTRFRAAGAEARIQLIERGDGNTEAGIRFLYTKADGAFRPDTAGMAFIGDYHWGKLLLRGNLFLTHDIGPESRDGIAAETRWRAAYSINKHQRVGLEMLNNFVRLRDADSDTVQHTLGPVWLGRVTDGSPWGFQLGMQFGLSRPAPDASSKLYINYNF